MKIGQAKHGFEFHYSRPTSIKQASGEEKHNSKSMKNQDPRLAKVQASYHPANSKEKYNAKSMKNHHPYSAKVQASSRLTSPHRAPGEKKHNVSISQIQHSRLAMSKRESSLRELTLSK